MAEQMSRMQAVKKYLSKVKAQQADEEAPTIQQSMPDRRMHGASTQVNRKGGR